MTTRSIEKIYLSARGLIKKAREVFKKVKEPLKGAQGKQQEISLDVFLFDGYGPIMHQSIDFGAMYRYTFASDGSLSTGYAHRLHARNCPSHANIYYISYDYPFGL
jgi:hypothetical protein